MQTKYALIVAGGTGSRMGMDIPKQYQLLAGKPVLMHTLAQFAKSESQVKLVLVLHKDMRAYWQSLCVKYAFEIEHEIIEGGSTRFQSVKNGIQFILAQDATVDSLIAIHDAARPLINPSLIDQSYACAREHGACIVALASSNSIRIGDNSVNKAVDRTQVWSVQTPQTFRLALLEEAFAQAESPLFTDDASVVEKLGHPIHIIPGEQKNMKITFPEDLEIAALLLGK